MAIHCQTCGSELATWTGKCPHCGGTSPMQIKAPQDPMMGKVIGGKYKVVKKLGQGGMGSVYMAENVGIGQRVAIKFLNPSFFGEETVVARFLNEARSYGQLSHPHAVQLHEHGQDDDGNLYISMEFVEGQDLKHLLEAQKRLPLRDALDVVLQICDVLSYAHGKGIVHRDLKPENVMVVKGLRGWHAKVMDFGVARLADTNRVTAAGSICGTPRYMAPEQAEGKDVDHRVDIYALGLVLFELLTGHHPFIGPTIAETMRRQVMEPMPHLRGIAPELNLPDALDAAIQKAVAKEPQQRWASMADFAQVLVPLMPTSTVEAGLLQQGVEQANTIVKGAPVEKTAHGSSPYDRDRPAPGRGKALLLGIGVGVAGLLGVAVFALRPPPPAVALDERPPDRPKIPELPPPPPAPKPADLRPAEKPPEPKPPEPKPADPKPADPKPAPTPNPRPADPRPRLPAPTPAPAPNPPPAAPDVKEATNAIQETRWASDMGSALKAFERGDLSEAASYAKDIPEASIKGADAAALRAKVAQLAALLARAKGAEAAGDCQGAMKTWGDALGLNPQLKEASAGIARCRKAIAPVGLE